MLSRATRFSSLKRWALNVAKRRGLKRAKVALARKLATVLHRLWRDGSEFRWSQANARGLTGRRFPDRGGACGPPPSRGPAAGTRTW